MRGQRGAGIQNQGAPAPVKGDGPLRQFPVRIENLLRIQRGHLPGLVQRDSAVGTVEEWNAQKGFQLLHGAAQSGLGHMQFCGSFGKGAAPGKDDELLQQK